VLWVSHLRDQAAVDSGLQVQGAIVEIPRVAVRGDSVSVMW